MKRKVRELAEQFRAGQVLIEDTAAGIQLVQELKREGFARIIPIKPKGDKIMRMAAQTPVIEAGRVFIPREAPWLQDYLHELMMFPKGKFDDQVDSTAQALAHIGKPSDADMWIEYYRQEALKNYGLVPDNLTITFDHSHADVEFRVSSGRTVHRDSDGFYHVTPGEWSGVQWMEGVTLIEDEGA